MSAVNNEPTSTAENTPIKLENEESTSSRWADMCDDYDVPLVDTYNEQNASKEKPQETIVDRREFFSSQKTDINHYNNCFEVSVRNLNANITQDEIVKLFEGLRIKRINILKKKGKTTNAYVEFDNLEDLNKSLLLNGNKISPGNKVEDGPISVIANKDKMKLYHSNQKQNKYKKLGNRGSNTFGSIRTSGTNNMNTGMNNYNNTNNMYNTTSNMVGSGGGNSFFNDGNKNMKNAIGSNGNINNGAISNYNSTYSYNHGTKMNYLNSQQNNQVFVNQQNSNNLNDKIGNSTGTYNFKNANYNQGGAGNNSNFSAGHHGKHLNAETNNAPPVERKRLVLKKRSVPLDQKEYVVNPSIFGSAKPVDVDPEKILSVKEKEKEQEREREREKKKEREKEKEKEKDLDTENDKPNIENSLYEGNIRDRTSSYKNSIGTNKERNITSLNSSTYDAGRDIKGSNNSSGRNVFNFKKGGTSSSGRNFINNNTTNNTNNSNNINNSSATNSNYQSNANKNTTGSKKLYMLGKSNSIFGSRKITNNADSNIGNHRSGNLNTTNAQNNENMPNANANFNNAVDNPSGIHLGRSPNQGQIHSYSQKMQMNRGYRNVENENLNGTRNSSTAATVIATGSGAMPMNKPKKSINIDIIRDHISNNTPILTPGETGKHGESKSSIFANRNITNDDFASLRNNNATSKKTEKTENVTNKLNNPISNMEKEEKVDSDAKDRKKETENPLDGSSEKKEVNKNDINNKEDFVDKNENAHTNETTKHRINDNTVAQEKKTETGTRAYYYCKRGSSYSNATSENADPDAIENLYDSSLKYVKNANNLNKAKKMTLIKAVKVITAEKKNEEEKENGAEENKEEKNANEDNDDNEKHGKEEKNEEKCLNEKNIETNEMVNNSDNYTYVTESSDDGVNNNNNTKDKDKDITTTNLKSALLQTKTKKKIKKKTAEEEEQNNNGNNNNENNQMNVSNRANENGIVGNHGTNNAGGDSNNNQLSPNVQNEKKGKIDILIKPNVKKGENVWEARTHLLVDQKESDDNDSALNKEKGERSDATNNSSHNSKRSRSRSCRSRNRTRSRNNSRRREHSRRRDDSRRDGRRKHHRDRERHRERDRSDRGRDRERDRERRDSRKDDGARDERANSYEYRKHRSYEKHGKSGRIGTRGNGNDRNIGNHYDRKRSSRYYNSSNGDKKNYDTRSYISEEKWKHKDSFDSSKNYKDYYDKGYKNSHDKTNYKDSTDKNTNKENYDKGEAVGGGGGNSGGKYATSSYSSSRHNKSYKHSSSHQKMNSYNSNYSSNYKSGSYYNKYSPKGSFYKDRKTSSKQLDKEKSQSKTDVPIIPKKAIVTTTKVSNVSIKKNRYECLDDGEESDK